MNRKRILYRILILWLILAAYVTLHEAGHAIMAIIFGGELKYFSINLLDARVSYSGSCTSLQTSVINAAGPGLPYFVWLVFMLLVSRRSGNFLTEYLKVYSLIYLVSMLSWVVIPVLYMHNKAPLSDDVTRFLDNSGMNGYGLALLVFLVVIFSFLLWIKKNPGAKQIFRLKDEDFAISRKRIVSLISISFLFLLLMTFPWINDGSPSRLGSNHLCNVRLDGLEGEYELCRIFIEEGKEEVDLIIHLQDASADFMHLGLVDKDSVSVTLINYTGFSVGNSTQNHPLTLEPGTYRIMMRAESIKGIWQFLRKNSRIVRPSGDGS